jgi:hypothetical protein
MMQQLSAALVLLDREEAKERIPSLAERCAAIFQGR